MPNIDNIIEQIKQGIKRQEMLIARENPETEKGRNNIEFYRRKITELDYRIKELEERKKSNLSILIPKYGDGKYAADSYKEAFDMLRVWYYNHFHQDPTLSPFPKRDMMFGDPTLWMPVDTYLVKGKMPFQIMFSANYPNHQADNTKSISVELPFEILSKAENEEYLRYILELIRIYSGDGINLVLGNGISTRGMLSFIADRELSKYYSKDMGYYEFFNSLCDNNVRNIIYIGDSMTKGVKPETIDKIQREIIDLHRRLTASEEVPEEELIQSNEKIKKRILSLNKNSI